MKKTSNDTAAGQNAASDLLTQVSSPMKRSRNAAPKSGTKPKAVAAAADLAHAPGKKHRKPAPSAHGAKHSDERIAKLRVANANRQRRSGGGR